MFDFIFSTEGYAFIKASAACMDIVIVLLVFFYTYQSVSFHTRPTAKRARFLLKLLNHGISLVCISIVLRVILGRWNDVTNSLLTVVMWSTWRVFLPRIHLNILKQFSLTMKDVADGLKQRYANKEKREPEQEQDKSEPTV